MTQSDLEIRAELIQKMGQGLGELFHKLRGEVHYLDYKWEQFEAMYGDDEDLVKKMNTISPFFFYWLQNRMFEDVILSISRITDPPTSNQGKKNNLSIRRISMHLQNEEELKSIVESIIKEIDNQIGFCRDWRNRFISHSDLELSLKKNGAIPLEEANRQKITKLIKSIQSLLQSVHEHYFESTILFSNIISQEGGKRVVELAFDGLKFDKLKWEYLEEGKIDPVLFE